VVKIYTKNYQFWRFRGCKPTFFEATMVKFGIRVRTWDFLPVAKVCKIAQGNSSLITKFLPKILNFSEFELHKPTVYTYMYDVEICTNF